MRQLSFSELVDRVDVVPYPHQPNYEVYAATWFKFTAHEGTIIGYMLPFVAHQFRAHPEVVSVDESERVVQILSTLDSLEKRNTAFAKVAAEWRELDIFDTLKGWRDELYTIYNPSHTPYLLAERAFTILLGVVTYGVHVVGYIPAEKSASGEIKFWIPRRSKTKPTFPSMLDNTVAGGLGYPYGLSETVFKECYEEAGLKQEYVAKNFRSAGVLTYMFQHEATLNSESGLIQPEIEFIYDLEIDEGHQLTPIDNEAEEFFLYDLNEVIGHMKKGEFKPNCALVLLDFMVRKGYLTAENEPSFLEIQRRSHRMLPFPTY